MAFAKLFGEKLQTKSGEIPTEEVLKGKAGVLVYFSAHWCPPCKGFTPKLSEFYRKHSAAKNFEIVFVSSDKDQGAFDEYFAEMPFVALPYAQRELKAKLSADFKVQGIPTVVVLGPDGGLITANGRAKVMADFDACADFPWHPMSFEQALGERLQKKDGSFVDTKAAIAGKTIGIYFSAHWCGPCREFTPKLKAFYEEYKKKDPSFEIIFSSGDRSAKGAMDYFQADHGDYLMIPYENEKGRSALDELFEVEGIPQFTLVTSEGKVINNEGKAKVDAGVAAVLEKGWEPPLVGDLAEGPSACGADINSAKAIVGLLYGLAKDEQERIFKEMEIEAKKQKDAKSPPDVIFLVSNEAGGVADQIGALTAKNGGPRCEKACADGKPLVLLFDIPSGGAFHVMDAVDTLNAAALADFIAQPGDRKQLER